MAIETVPARLLAAEQEVGSLGWGLLPALEVQPVGGRVQRAQTGLEHWTCRGAAARRLWSPPVLFHLCQGPRRRCRHVPTPSALPAVLSGAQVGRFERPEQAVLCGLLRCGCRSGRALLVHATSLSYQVLAVGVRRAVWAMGLARPCPPDPCTAADPPRLPRKPRGP